MQRNTTVAKDNFAVPKEFPKYTNTNTETRTKPISMAFLYILGKKKRLKDGTIAMGKSLKALQNASLQFIYCHFCAFNITIRY
jgi:hypothetical protein